MSDPRIYRIFALITAMALLISACGSSDSQESAISTAVAQTVQAGGAPTETPSLPTSTVTPQMLPTDPALTATTAPTIAPTVVAPSDPNCLKASLVSDNPPDNTIMKPGELFWKTWTVQNNGTCTWTTAYKFIYWSGDLLGGLTSYALPNDVAPNGQIDISIYLKAPDTAGTFTGYWRIQAPWQKDFGVGMYDEPLSVQLVVSDAKKVKYGVTTVDYVLDRNPPIGCPTNVRFTIYATITVNGPAEVDYRWIQSDGNSSGSRPLNFTAAGSATVQREWMIGKGDSSNDRWAQIVILEPQYQEFGKVLIKNVCP